MGDSPKQLTMSDIRVLWTPLIACGLVIAIVCTLSNVFRPLKRYSEEGLIAVVVHSLQGVLLVIAVLLAIMMISYYPSFEFENVISQLYVILWGMIGSGTCLGISLGLMREHSNQSVTT